MRISNSFFSPDIIYIANESLFDICEILSSLIM